MRLARISIAITLLLTALPVVAEEIIHLKSGRSMAVVSHTIADGMVQVDLGENGFIAFPESAVESIETAGSHVALRPSYGSGANRRVPTPDGNYPVQGIQRERKRDAIPMPNQTSTPVETNPQTGMASYRPEGRNPGVNKRGLQVNGNMRVFGNAVTTTGSPSSFAGTTQIGTRNVIGGGGPRRSNNPSGADRRPQIVGLGLRDGGVAPPASTPTDGSRSGQEGRQAPAPSDPPSDNN